MSRKNSASSIDKQSVQRGVSRTTSATSGKESVSGAKRPLGSRQSTRTTSSSASSQRSDSSRKPEIVKQSSSRTGSVIWQSWPEEPSKHLMPIFSGSLSPELTLGPELDSTPLPKATVPKISAARHRAHVAKKYSSTKAYRGIYDARGVMQVMRGVQPVKIIHARVYLFYKRQGFADEHIVDLADPEKNIGSYGFFQGNFDRLFEHHFGISSGRARVIYAEKRMPEPWMDVHLDIEISREMRDGKEVVRESALGLYKPVVLGSSKMEELKRNGGKCGAWIEEAERNERRREAEKYDK